MSWCWLQLVAIQESREKRARPEAGQDANNAGAATVPVRDKMRKAVATQARREWPQEMLRRTRVDSSREK